VIGPDGKSALVNYRVRGTTYTVDRLFAAAELRLGTAPQRVVRIIRTDAVSPADRGAPPAVSFTGGFRTPADRPSRVWRAQRAGPHPKPVTVPDSCAAASSSEREPKRCPLITPPQH